MSNPAGNKPAQKTTKKAVGRVVTSKSAEAGIPGDEFLMQLIKERDSAPHSSLDQDRDVEMGLSGMLEVVIPTSKKRGRSGSAEDFRTSYSPQDLEVERRITRSKASVSPIADRASEEPPVEPKERKIREFQEAVVCSFCSYISPFMAWKCKRPECSNVTCFKMVDGDDEKEYEVHAGCVLFSSLTEVVNREENFVCVDCIRRRKVNFEGLGVPYKFIGEFTQPTIVTKSYRPLAILNLHFGTQNYGGTSILTNFKNLYAQLPANYMQVTDKMDPCGRALQLQDSLVDHLRIMPKPKKSLVIFNTHSTPGDGRLSFSAGGTQSARLETLWEAMVLPSLRKEMRQCAVSGLVVVACGAAFSAEDARERVPAFFKRSELTFLLGYHGPPINVNDVHLQLAEIAERIYVRSIPPWEAVVDVAASNTAKLEAATFVLFTKPSPDVVEETKEGGDAEVGKSAVIGVEGDGRVDADNISRGRILTFSRPFGKFLGLDWPCGGRKDCDAQLVDVCAIHSQVSDKGEASARFRCVKCGEKWAIKPLQVRLPVPSNKMIIEWSYPLPRPTREWYKPLASPQPRRERNRGNTGEGSSSKP